MKQQNIPWNQSNSRPAAGFEGRELAQEWCFIVLFSGRRALLYRMMTEDGELLARYAAEQSEEAFAELTRRHVDLVYSAALRMVNGDVGSAQDVTQLVFTEAARQAKELARHPALVGWFYTTTRLMALRANRTDQRRRAREQKVHTMNELLHEDSAPDWNELRPVIEEAMHELGEKDRHAVLLRYFQNKSLREVGMALDLTENAARMRVERALDKLRGQLARRGVTTTASALAAVVGANAVQAAPAGLAVMISAGVIAGGALPVSTLVTATKTIAMTTLQKTIVATALAAAVGTGIFAINQKSQMGDRIDTLQQNQAPLNARIEELEQERSQATNQLAAVLAENARLKSNPNADEVLKLRGEVTHLRQSAGSEATDHPPASGLAKMMSDPAMKEYLRQAQMEKLKTMFQDFIKESNLTPEQSDQFLKLMTDEASKSMERLMATGEMAPDPADAQAFGAQLHALLGDDGMARFQDYHSELPARTIVSQLNGQLGDTPLDADQSAQLLQIVKAEPIDLTRGVTGMPDPAFMGSQADIDNFLQQVEQSNQRILQQSGSFLTPDQLAALNTVLTNSVSARQLQGAALIQKH
jgi:RNA polymerase sigma factor (sigma-70 family)